MEILKLLGELLLCFQNYQQNQYYCVPVYLHRLGPSLESCYSFHYPVLVQYIISIAPENVRKPKVF